MMINAVLIDDDHNLRNGMKAMLSLYAPEINIIGEAESVKTGTQLIEKTNPEIIFLDIMMNDGSGFDILEQLNKKISSHIVFVTAHEKFAIKAFRFSALDFLLKPVDPEDLQTVIKKIKNILLIAVSPSEPYRKSNRPIVTGHDAVVLLPEIHVADRDE